MTNAKRTVVMVVMLGLGASVGVLLMGGATPGSTMRNLPVVQGPELAEESLTAAISTVSAGSRQGSGSEVQLSGSMHGFRVEEVVFRSQESPDMLRLGWESADHLVVSVPQYSQDAGRAPGEGDASFACGSRSKAVRVSCDTYPVGAR